MILLLKKERGNFFSPNMMWTGVPYNQTPMCYQWAYLPPFYLCPISRSVLKQMAGYKRESFPSGYFLLKDQSIWLDRSNKNIKFIFELFDNIEIARNILLCYLLNVTWLLSFPIQIQTKLEGEKFKTEFC